MTPLPKVPTHMDTDNTYTSANANVNDNDGMDGIAISVGDSVKITGLLSDHQYNGTRGIVVSAVDPKTNRCGVRINADKTLALRVQNLSVVRWAKTGNTGGLSADGIMKPWVFLEKFSQTRMIMRRLPRDTLWLPLLPATRTAGRPSKSKTCTCCATFVMNVTKML